MRRLCSGFLGRSALIVLASSSTFHCALPRRACFVVEAPSHRWSSTTATARVPTEDANAAPVNLVTPSDEPAEKACRVVRFLPKSGFIVASHPDEPTSNILVTHARADEALKAQWNELRVGSVINLRFDRTKNPGPCAYFATSATLCVNNNNEDTTHLRSVEVVVVHTSEAEGTSLAISAATHKARFDIKERFPIGTRLNVDANAISKDKFVVINVNEEIAKPTVLEKVEVELTEETATQGNFFARWVDSETGALNRLLVSNKLAAEAKIRLRTGVKLLVDVVSFKPTTRLDRALKIHSVTAEADEQKRDLIVVAPQFLRGTAVLLGCPNDRFKTYVFPIKALNGVELRKGDHVQAVIEDATDGQSYPSLHSLSVVGNLPSFRLKNCRVVHHDEESKNVTLVSEDGRKVTAFAPSSESRNVGDVYYSLECRDMPGCESAVCLGFHDSSAVVLANVHARYLGPERTGRQGVVIVPSTGKGDQIFGDAPRYARFSKAASPKPGELRRGDPLLCQVTAGVNLTPLISEWKFTPNLTDMKSLAELEEALNEHKLRRDTGGETTKKPSTTSRPSETAFVISLDATGTILTAGDDGWTAHAAGLDVSVAFSVADLAPGTNRKNLTVNTQIKLDVWITSTNIFVGRNVRL